MAPELVPRFGPEAEQSNGGKEREGRGGDRGKYMQASMMIVLVQIASSSKQILRHLPHQGVYSATLCRIRCE